MPRESSKHIYDLMDYIPESNFPASGCLLSEEEWQQANTLLAESDKTDWTKVQGYLVRLKKEFYKNKCACLLCGVEGKTLKDNDGLRYIESFGMCRTCYRRLHKQHELTSKKNEIYACKKQHNVCVVCRESNRRMQTRYVCRDCYEASLSLKKALGRPVSVEEVLRESNEKKAFKEIRKSYREALKRRKEKRMKRKPTPQP